LNSCKYFLCDVDSFAMIVDWCNDIDKSKFLSSPLDVWSETMSDCDVKITINRPPVYIAAEYNKYSRKVSQTPFAFAMSSVLTLIVEQMRKWKNSEIEISKKEEIKSSQNERKEDKMSKNEILNPHSNSDGWIDLRQNIATNNIFCCDEVIFHSAGREDMDVRMLGAGRPLLLQLINPKNTLSLCNEQSKELEEFVAFANINCDAMIGIRNMRIVDEKYQEWMKSIENTKNKMYRCLCWISDAMTDQKALDDAMAANGNYGIEYPLVLQQWTPIRVLHRRSLSVRERKLFSIDIKWISEHWISVEIAAEAGTYIKEFCHGDRGRTVPNLASLLKCKHANIIQLDVTAVLT